MSEKVTFREIGTPAFEPPWDEKRYAQLDHVLIHPRWKNAIQDICAKPFRAKHSDHAPVYIKFHCKLRILNKKKTKLGNETKYWPPDDESILHYNSAFEEYWDYNFNKLEDPGEHNPHNIKIFIDDLQDILNKAVDAGRSNFWPLPKEKKKDYITRSTWELITQRDELQHWHTSQEENKAERLKELNSQIQKSARKDRRAYWQANIEDEEDELKKKWKKLRCMKKDYTPNYTKAEDMHGNRIPWGKSAGHCRIPRECTMEK